MKSRPLRFLAAVLVLWVCARAAMLAPGWWGSGGDADRLALPTAAAPPPPQARVTAIDSARASLADADAPSSIAFPPLRRAGARHGHSLAREVPYKGIGRPALAISGALDPGPGPILVAGQCCTLSAAAGSDLATALPPVAQPLAPPTAGAGRWSGSAWLLVRRDRDGPALAPGGTLGGSQAGARLLYRMGGGFGLSARVYAPLRRPAGAEAALGIDWRPWPRLPFRLLAERRHALGGEGRSAFALTLYGGATERLPLGLRLEAWGQAGLVGTRSRDLFADGAVRVSAPLGPVEIGGGAWGAAQPGASRVDAGPSVAWRLPVAHANLRFSADWRFRLAGAAAPGSGPAFTLATGF
jgi:hypothetical protein